MRADVDDESTRDRIIEEIRAEPGTYRKRICQRLGLCWGTITYHVRILKMSQAITERPHRGRSLLFPAGMAPEEMRRASALDGPRRRNLYNALQEENPLGIQDLSNRLGLSRKVVRRILEDFHAHGLVERQPGHHGKFLPTPMAEDEIRASPRQELVNRMRP